MKAAQPEQQRQELGFQIRDWISAHQLELVAWNKKLVSKPSMNRFSDGDEAGVQQIVAKRLQMLGCIVDQFIPTQVEGIEGHPSYLEGRQYRNRPNVVGRKRGKGTGRSLMFSGHMDTAPLGDRKWSVSPFEGEVREGRQYGLGILDMKSGMAAAMAALQALDETGISLSGDVWIESVVDEEFGGANGTLACRLKGYEADLTIIPEPTNLTICPASQGGAMYRFTYEGTSGRGFSGEKLINPAFAAAKFIDIFKLYQAYHAGKLSQSPWYDNGDAPAYIQGMQAGSPEYPIYDRSPSSCSIDVWIQCYPGVTEEEQFKDFLDFYAEQASEDEILANWPVKSEQLIRFLPGMEARYADQVVPFLQDLSKQSFAKPLPVHGAPFACDAFMFDLYSDTSVIICGPKGGNAHSEDEYIELNAFYQLVEYYALIMMEWCGVER